MLQTARQKGLVWSQPCLWLGERHKHKLQGIQQQVAQKRENRNTGRKGKVRQARPEESTLLGISWALGKQNTTALIISPSIHLTYEIQGPRHIDQEKLQRGQSMALWPTLLSHITAPHSQPTKASFFSSLCIWCVCILWVSTCVWLYVYARVLGTCVPKVNT